MEKTAGFEASFEQLQSIVRKMESGELSLEDSLKSFEEGVRLSRECQKYLGDAEQRVQVLTQQSGADGRPDSKPFTP